MKKIDFGFNNDKRLNASFAGIELYNGEYLDVVGCNQMDFLITRIVDSGRGLNGKIDVREVAQDYYADGSYDTYANQEKNEVCKKLEEFFNTASVKEKIKNNEPIIGILRKADFPVYTSKLASIPSKSEVIPGLVTSIRPELFEELKKSKKYSTSMFNQYKEIQRLYKEIKKMKSDDYEKGTGRKN